MKNVTEICLVETLLLYVGRASNNSSLSIALFTSFHSNCIATDISLISVLNCFIAHIKPNM